MITLHMSLFAQQPCAHSIHELMQWCKVIDSIKGKYTVSMGSVGSRVSITLIEICDAAICNECHAH